ncbi:hypothetical protein ABPG74_012464 [Tetrahymena malaccensis]
MIKTSGFGNQFTEQYEDYESKFTEVPFTPIYKEYDEYKKEFCQYTNRNHSWKTALFQQQNILLDLHEMTNVKYLVIDDFKYGCEMTISLSEFKSGPYIPIFEKKYFCRSTEKRINLSCLPCRYIQINVSKGVHVHIQSIRIVGIKSNELATELGLDFFKVMVSGPQRIMYK